MIELDNTLDKLIKNRELIEVVLSNKSTKLDYNKIDIKPVLIQDKLFYQFTLFFNSKVEHYNIEESKSKDKILDLLKTSFRQAMIFSIQADYQVLISKKGRVKIIKHQPSKTMPDLSHNRKKDYIIDDHTPCDFLIRLGVMGENGRVHKNMYDKFKQINRFLELVDDLVHKIDRNRTLNIVDFGCGKSYLTFALYHYLVELQGLDINIIGLDLKKDVIDFCNEVRDDLNYQKLNFIQGDIQYFEHSGDIDMIVTLHACDTATDAALVKAIDWDVDFILSVPCCQKEIRRSLDNDLLRPMLKHGIIKEEISSLVTDSLRAFILELLGYEVQLVEFINIENTPKNILIRAVKNKKKPNQEELDSYFAFKDFWNLDKLYIEEELKKIEKFPY